MKFKAIVVGLLLCALMVSGAMCQSSPSLQKPKVSYVPLGWYLSADDAYNPTDGFGLVEYTDSSDFDFVQIYYQPVPESLKGRESDSNALIAQAVMEAIFSPDDTGPMTVAGRLAGYAETYDAYYGTWETEIVFVYDNTYVDIYTAYNASEWNIQEATSIIESIYF
jgi:uncharacterized protein YukJ